jgi:hypothetical protein
MKALNLIAWISGGIGSLLILLGSISFLIKVNFLHVNSIANIFNVANSFFLITIALFILLHKCDCKKE